MAEYTGRKVLLKDEDDNAIIPYVDGVIDSNTSNTVKTWTGTKAQYDAISTKDSNTLYNITDDESSVIATLNNLIQTTQNQINTILDGFYPVGSVYLATTSTCPLASLIAGSMWEQMGTSLITSVNTSVPIKGTGMSLGMYNGSINGTLGSGNSGMYTGTAGYGKNAGTSQSYDMRGDISLGVTTDSSKSGIVGTVTRTSISVYIFKRTA